MELITPPSRFSHAGQLPQDLLASDPRDSAPEDFTIDLRACEFVRPPAVLWCAISCLLAVRRGTSCGVLAPENVGVARYLKATGLFDLLKEHGVSVDDGGIEPALEGRMVVPVQALGSETDVDRIANVATESLLEHHLGAVNLREIVVDIFSELAGNAVEHAESPVGPYSLIQYDDRPEGARFLCVVADGGIGIRASLVRSPDIQASLSDDWRAIQIAMEERISGTGIATRGIGLFDVSHNLTGPGRELLIHSGLGIVQTERSQTRARKGPLFPGTLVSASVRT
jgi:anti-sigma regulatory factor (Ser/Thr protein kinase)